MAATEKDWDNMTDDEVCAAVGCQDHLDRQDEIRAEKHRAWVNAEAQTHLTFLYSQKARAETHLRQINEDIEHWEAVSCTTSD